MHLEKDHMERQRRNREATTAIEKLKGNCLTALFSVKTFPSIHSVLELDNEKETEMNYDDVQGL